MAGKISHRVITAVKISHIILSNFYFVHTGVIDQVEELRIIAEQAGLWRLRGDKLCQVWHIDDILFVSVVFKQQWDIGEW